MDPITSFLLEDRNEAAPGSGVSPMELSAFAKEAAVAFVKKAQPLSATIYEQAKTHGLNNEQIKRVVEKANTDTFLLLKQSSAYKYNIQFPVADFAKVAAMLESKPEKLASANIPQEYEFRARTKSWAHGYSFDELLNEMGIPTEVEKVASAHDILGRRNTQIPFQAARERIRLSAELGRQETALQDEHFALAATMDKLGSCIKQARREGYSLSDITASVYLGEPKPVLVDLIEDSLGIEFDDPRTSLQKVAAEGMVASPSNPIPTLVEELNQISTRLVATNDAVAQAKAAIDLLTGVLVGPTPEPPVGGQFVPPTAEPPLAQQGPPPPPGPQGPPGPPPVTAQ